MLVAGAALLAVAARPSSHATGVVRAVRYADRALRLPRHRHHLEGLAKQQGGAVLEGNRAEAGAQRHEPRAQGALAIDSQRGQRPVVASNTVQIKGVRPALAPFSIPVWPPVPGTRLHHVKAAAVGDAQRHCQGTAAERIPAKIEIVALEPQLHDLCRVFTFDDVEVHVVPEFRWLHHARLATRAAAACKRVCSLCEQVPIGRNAEGLQLAPRRIW
mmetsp:Transcript_33230/g.94943  ORF Transcript_33230/g.94943 Transcript_33230/m.94943 type:complete len:216 (+) Transcript_33230:11160-11807(+)